MATAKCTRACRHCGAEFMRVGKGHPTQYCGIQCRDEARRAYDRERSRWQGFTPRHLRPPCTVEGCEGRQAAKGYCSKHYGRLRAHGDPLFTTHGLRVEKPCGCCGKAMTLRPSIAKIQDYCSRPCAKNVLAAKQVKHATIACPRCGKQFRQSTSNGRLTTFCSKQCLAEQRAKARRVSVRVHHYPCAECGTRTHGPGTKRHCSDACLALTQKRQRQVSSDRRRARKLGVCAERIDKRRVFERDKWKCHLCGCKTLRQWRRGHPRAPEMDHIVTLAEGGGHTWGNVACACRACNRAKSSRSLGQLGLAFSA